MRVFIVKKDAKAYNLEGTNFDNWKLVKSYGTFMNEGRNFHGEKVFLRLKNGFKPMIKVLDINLKKNYYYYPNDVKSLNNESVDSNFVGGEFYKKTRNFVFANANTNQISPITDYKNSFPQYSSAIGDSLQNLISNIKDKTEYNLNEVKQIYQDSKSKLPFEDWLNSKEGKDTVNNISNIALSLLNKPKSDNLNQNNELSNENTQSEFKIFGLHPLTFGIVSIGTLFSAILIITFIQNKKNK